METRKKTKIVATLGPVSSDEKTLIHLVEAGLNVARINFSHGDAVEHAGKVRTVRKVSKKLGVPVAILQDLSGPKIRIGDFYQERVELKAGERFVLTTEKCVGDEHRAFVNYPALPKEIKPGKHILLDDGKKRLKVLRIKGNEIHCEILVGGDTKGRRGVNLPGTDLGISSITAKDRKDLEFAFEHDVDFVALSFVRRAEDVDELRALLKKRRSRAQIIAKIETSQAVEHLDAIVAAADGVMVARGDLAVEVPMEEVPVLQKRIIKQARKQGKPVIVATQMLESMIHSPVPTRAEVNDVANAILDGTDAVMLSEETTLGEFPVEAVATMTRIALHTERHYPHRHVIRKPGEESPVNPVVDVVTQSLVNTAHEVEAKVIIALTESGFTPRMVSRHRPDQPILVLTPDARNLGRMALSFGCVSFTVKPFQYVQQVMDEARKLVIREKFAKKGDRIVIVAGVPFGKSGGANLVMVETV